MRFYTQQHPFYCGIDLHARSMYVCILNHEGEVVAHRNLPAEPEPFLEIIQPYREDIVVAVECVFTWYWLADLCERETIPFVLRHALYMKAIHGAKVKNDRVDACRQFQPLVSTPIVMAPPLSHTSCSRWRRPCPARAVTPQRDSFIRVMRYR